MCLRKCCNRFKHNTQFDYHGYHIPETGFLKMNSGPCLTLSFWTTWTVYGSMVDDQKNTDNDLNVSMIKLA